ncbi:hypothetical protein SY88_16585 [Clostridiales bacterium PH28_bin88]|nr:hypothetical protein SY88_16585 [Clostridiales bacterium PH28_bin88]
MGKKINSELVMLALVALFSAALLVESFSYPRVPAQFPRIISFITLVMAGYTLAGRLLPGAKEKPGKPSQPHRSGVLWYGLAALVFAYLGLIYLAGFTVATFLFLECLPLLLGYRKPVTVTITAVVATFVLTAAMKWVFLVPVPPGIWFS